MARDRTLYLQPTAPPVSLTLFAIPKPFVGQIGEIQRNAIQSWSRLVPRPAIWLFGDEVGTAKVADDVGAVHQPQITRNQSGTPCLDTLFAAVQQSQSHILAYFNSDVIVLQDFMDAVYSVAAQLEAFLMVGRRWDVEQVQPLGMNSEWEVPIRQQVQQTGCLAIPDAKDYFVFPNGLFAKIPPFAVGRGYWDTWVVRSALDQGLPVVDASLVVTAVHPEHDYRHIAGGRSEAYMGQEAQCNKALGNVQQSGAIADATHLLQTAQTPLLSVVITAATFDQTLGSTIDSVLRQSADELEVIVVGNPTDEGSAWLQSCGDRIRFYPHPQPDLINARNTGLSAATGDFILFLQAGCTLLPNVLQPQLDQFATHSSVLDLVLSGWQIGDRPIEPWHDLPDLSNLHIWALRSLWQPLSSSVGVFRRDRLLLINGFNPNLSETASRVDAILRLVALRGCQAAWCHQLTYTCSNAAWLHQESDRLPNEWHNYVTQFFEYPEVRSWMRTLKAKAVRAINGR